MDAPRSNWTPRGLQSSNEIHTHWVGNLRPSSPMSSSHCSRTEGHPSLRTVRNTSASLQVRILGGSPNACRFLRREIHATHKVLKAWVGAQIAKLRAPQVNARHPTGSVAVCLFQPKEGLFVVSETGINARYVRR